MLNFLEASKKFLLIQRVLIYKKVLKKRILDSNIVLALAGIYASHSEWMVWEMDTAKDNGIPIIGVVPRGQERISSEVLTRSIVDVKWNTESIIAAIRQHAI